jgi:hypothetical protein
MERPRQLALIDRRREAPERRRGERAQRAEARAFVASLSTPAAARPPLEPPPFPETCTERAQRVEVSVDDRLRWSLHLRGFAASFSNRSAGTPAVAERRPRQRPKMKRPQQHPLVDRRRRSHWSGDGPRGRRRTPCFRLTSLAQAVSARCARPTTSCGGRFISADAPLRSATEKFNRPVRPPVAERRSRQPPKMKQPQQPRSSTGGGGAARAETGRASAASRGQKGWALAFDSSRCAASAQAVSARFARSTTGCGGRFISAAPPLRSATDQ